MILILGAFLFITAVTGVTLIVLASDDYRE